MADELKEPGAPEGETTIASGLDGAAANHIPEALSSNGEVISRPGVDDAAPEPSVYTSHSDPYGHEEEPGPPPSVAVSEVIAEPEPPAAQALAPLPPKNPPPPPPPPPDDDDEDDPEEKGMLRMSFMEHLEELRSRLLKAIAGILLAFLGSIAFALPLWNVISAPAVDALKKLGVNPPHLTIITPMEGFNVIYLKLPLLISIFVGSPWIFYQIWAFISPGLYKREKRWAVPFILTTAGLFIAGGCFAYFVAFRFGLEFLLGIGLGANVTPMVSIETYFDLFVNVTLGIGLVFEMPVIIFFLTLLRLASPRFLLRHSRYAILAITIIAAVVTPTPDAFNMMLFTVPMVMLYFVGLFASYLLVLRRENKKFPWRTAIYILLGVIALAGAALAVLIFALHYHFAPKWPYLVR